MADLLPSGTVTLLLADVEGSTRLWERQPGAMSAAIARLNSAADQSVAVHQGVRPLEQGEGDSFVAAFARASDALACALELQRMDLAPIRLRIGVHTGEVLLRDESNYAGTTVNKTARLRDLAHGGQTVVSGATEEVVEDRIPDGAWLTELGNHVLRDVPRRVRVLQLCHPDLRADFPPLRTADSVASHNLPAQLTTFVGRRDQIAEVRATVAGNRLTTLTGAGGAGKTRLSVEVASRLADEFPAGIWYTDLAPVMYAEVVPLAVARALGLPDQPGRSITETVMRYVGERRILLVLDNCEHLLEPCAALTSELLGSCANAAILATSREPLMVPGEVIWQVPSLSVTDEAVELFADRARRARPDFAVTAANAAAVTEICRRLDGMPLAIELAAARIRALSLDEIVGGLHDRFRLLTGGARTAVRRQQTLRASVDWSHALLTEAERVLFRRLSVFMGGFDLGAAHAVAGATEMEAYQVLDQLGLLVDKSLVVADNSSGSTRYRLLETVRQYALEKLGESGEADRIRVRHRDHFASLARRLDSPARNDYEQLIEQAETELDNLRAAFSWSHENGDAAAALDLASSLQSLWLARGRLVEGLAWLTAALDTAGAQPDVPRARALADEAVLNSWVDVTASRQHAMEALAIARDADDVPLLTRALTACACITAHDPEIAQPYFDEAIGMARELDDSWRLSLILGRQAYGAFMAGDLAAAERIGREGLGLADAIGDHFNSRQCRWVIIDVMSLCGELTAALAQTPEFVAEATAGHDAMNRTIGQMIEATLLAWSGEGEKACAAARLCIESGAEMAGLFDQGAYSMLGIACLAAGDLAGARQALQDTREAHINLPAERTNLVIIGELALACGDLADARQWLDEAVVSVQGWWQCSALSVRARVHLAAHDLDRAAADAYRALSLAAESGGYITVPEILESIAELACHHDSPSEAARLYGAAEAARSRIGVVRFPVYDGRHRASLTALHTSLGDKDFDAAWAEGSALSTEEAVAYAMRGRGERKRPATGWASLTPAELDVVRLVAEGIPNKDIAVRLFISPRTVQSHLRHVYHKLGLSSRVQLANEVATQLGSQAGRDRLAPNPASS
ncbi:LuxR C-terminal-related transcriptional regulator [Mycobacterium sp. Y57]|nr:LuxR C-terminal-related transcriptional regulator [Mycolicibacterium xanthum]